MKIKVPNYYKNFKCIADKCRHSCCVGWEIDIDEKTMAHYSALTGEIGTMLKDNISTDPEPHFVLKEGDRCPFLKDNGLCHLICTLGENSLCNICADHPRFRNFYHNGVEMGVGLCCEAACKLVLFGSEPFSLEGEDFEYTDEEEYVVNLRNKYISCVQDETLTPEERFNNILTMADCHIAVNSFEQWVEFFLSLERLDCSWTEALNSLSHRDFAFPSDKSSMLVSKLCIYFLYRHVPSAIVDGDVSSKVGFAVLSSLFIYNVALCIQGRYTSLNNAICDVARMYSAEIEYSDENLDAIFTELSF